MSKKPVIYHVINGKRYKIQFLPKSAFDNKTDGTCDAPQTKNKAIKIRKGMSEIDTLETIIHEAAHAALWHHEEQFIESFAKDLSRLLIRLGYTKAE